jgi:hypothetical protein
LKPDRKTCARSPARDSNGRLAGEIEWVGKASPAQVRGRRAVHQLRLVRARLEGRRRQRRGDDELISRHELSPDVIVGVPGGEHAQNLVARNLCHAALDPLRAVLIQERPHLGEVVHVPRVLRDREADVTDPIGIGRFRMIVVHMAAQLLEAARGALTNLAHFRIDLGVAEIG